MLEKLYLKNYDVLLGTILLNKNNYILKFDINKKLNELYKLPLELYQYKEFGTVERDYNIELNSEEIEEFLRSRLYDEDNMLHGGKHMYVKDVWSMIKAIKGNSSDDYYWLTDNVNNKFEDSNLRYKMEKNTTNKIIKYTMQKNKLVKNIEVSRINDGQGLFILTDKKYIV